MTLAFDIETKPLDTETITDRSKPFEYKPFVDEPFVPHKGYKPETNQRKAIEWEESRSQRIAEHAASQSAKEEEYIAHLVEGSTLKAHLSSLLCISYCAGKQNWIEWADDEQETLQSFWSHVRFSVSKGDKVVGFNIRAFDLPYLIQRSIISGVVIPVPVFEKQRFLHDSFRDVADMWNLASGNHITLAALAATLGYHKIDLDGKLCWQVDPALAEKYALHDAYLAYELYHRLNYCLDTFGIHKEDADAR